MFSIGNDSSNSFNLVTIGHLHMSLQVHSKIIYVVRISDNLNLTIRPIYKFLLKGVENMFNIRQLPQKPL